MKLYPILRYLFWFTLWHTVAGTLYTDKEIVFDGSTTGMENPVFTDTTVLTLSNSKVTIKNYAKVALPAGFLLQNGSTLTITPLSGIDRPFSLDVNGDAKFTTASKFIFDGSKLSYSSSVQALNLFHFSFDLGAGGLILLQDDTFSVTLPTYGSYTLGSKRPSIKIGSTITDTLKYSPVVIYGTFSIDQIDRTHLYQVDFGPDKPVVAPGNAPALSVINTKIYGITCLYANIFQNTIGGSLSTSGLHAYVPQNAFTLNLLYQPTFTNPNEEPYDILFTADQTALITIKNMIQYPSDIYQLQGPFPAIRVLSNGAGVLSSSFSDPNQLLNLAIGSANVRFRLPKPERKFDLLAIGSNKDLSPNYAIPNYSNVLTIALIGDLVIRPPYTTTHTDPKTTEILLISDYSSSDAVNHQWVIGHSTVTLYNQPQGDTKIIDLGNGVTEYQVLSYEPSQILNPANPLKPYATVTRTVLYSPPPVTTISIDQNHEHIEEIVSYFITTDSNGKIITDSKVIPITTKYDPAPDPETNTIDLGNEITEYVVISYWTTLNEDGKIITTSKVQTYSPPPVTVTATTAADYVESDWISFFITTNEKGEIITDSTLFNATRDYNLPEAPHTSFGPAPPAETKTVDLGNEVTEYLVISYWTTTNEFGGLITTSSTRTYSPPPVTVTATTAADYVESDWISFFITTNEKGEIITDSTLFNATRDYNLPEAPHTSFGPAPPAETKTVDLGNEVTEYLVISYWTTTNEFGGLITTSSTRTYSPPPVTVTATTAADYVESDWISFFITTNEKGEIITDSTLFNATRDYNLPEAPHTSFGPAPPAETKTVDLGNEVTEYLVISYWTTTNEFGGLITTSSTRTYSPPPVTVTATTAADYVESDWISFFITTNEKGEIITDSTLFNATRDYNLPEAPHTSFGPAPPAETKTVDLGNEVTEYLVISYWTTTNEFGGLITTSSTRTYSPPPVTVTATTAADYVESDWISFFITTNEKGEIITDSTLFNATRDYNLPEAPHTSFGPAPPAETKTVDLGNEVTEYLVISYWTTTNEFGGLITTSSTRTYSPPPVTVTATTAADYVESDWISFFITTNEKGEIITDSTLFNATREFIDAEELYVSSSSISSLLLSSSVLLTSDVVVPTSNSGTSTSSISSFISNSVVLSSSISSSSVIFSSVDKPSMLSSSESGSDLLSSSSTIESAGIIGSSVIVSVSTSSFNSDIVTALGSSTYSLVHSLSSDLGSVNSFNSSTLMTEGELPGSTSHHTSVYPTSESEVIEVSENSTIDIDTYDPYSTSTEHQDINEEIPSNSIQSTYTDSTSTTQITSSYYGINSEMDTNASHILSHYYSTSKDGIVITSVVTISTVSPGHSPVSNIADKSDSSRVNTVITPPNSVINNFATNNAEQSLSIENHNSLPKSNDNLSEVLYGTATTLTKSIYHTYDTLQGNSVVSVLTSTSTLPNVSSKSTLPTSSIQRTSQSVSEGTASIETLYKASGSHHKKSATLLESILLIFIILLV
ncbi:uncharacterized protein GWK60_C00077 [Nakaseomyces glabratus]|nr:hypothetical protein J6894_00431 [Nakaseomyces glabratus]QNG12530.1 uncharacterized protein GWK60_C00077 [Nakaseomyces glabratus]